MSYYLKLTMVNKIITPQEVEVFYFIPAIRKRMAIVFKKQGLQQKEIAQILGITGAAVSQYLHEKRAKEFKLPKKIAKEIEESCKKENKNIVMEITRILNLLKKERCSLCSDFNEFNCKGC